ncbi:MAG: hypothetical protein WC082_15550 [Victivallales bacterium]
MLTAKEVKEFARKAGADIVGIASMDRFEGAPKQMDPRYIFPEGKSMIVLGFRIHRGCFRGIEEGTYFISYATMGYAHINQLAIPSTLRSISSFVEDNGWEAVPVPMENHFSAISDCNGELLDKPTVPVSPDKPVPDVMFNFRIAAVAAGLGEIGWSNLLLTPEFGPRQRVAAIITDAPLEADPLFEGELCDRCMLCVKDCAGQAISKTESVKVNIGGKECEWAKLDATACSIAYAGGVREASPFLSEDISFDLEKSNENRKGDGRPDLRKLLPFADHTLSTFHHWPAIEGARGCVRACMNHLEQQGKLTNKFNNPFRKKPLWKIKPSECQDCKSCNSAKESEGTDTRSYY